MFQPLGVQVQVGLPLLEALNRVSCGGMVLQTNGEIYAINETAKRIFESELQLPAESHNAIPSWGRSALKRLLGRANLRFNLEENNWFTIPRPERRPLLLHAVPLPEVQLEGPHTIIILIDLDVVPRCNNSALEKIFYLTHAEARLAILVSEGATVTEAAATLNVKVSTVRTQLASIYAKTGTRRQAQLITLVCRLSILP